MSKVFTQHKNGDVSLRLTPIEREIFSCLIGRMRYKYIEDHPVFEKALVKLEDRSIKMSVIDTSGNLSQVAVITFESK